MHCACKYVPCRTFDIHPPTAETFIVSNIHIISHLVLMRDLKHAFAGTDELGLIFAVRLKGMEPSMWVRV